MQQSLTSIDCQNNQNTSNGATSRATKLTLKDYITSYNYRREVQYNAKVKSKSKTKNNPQNTRNQRQSIGTIRYQNNLDSKIRQIILFARAAIPQDDKFIQMEKMLEELRKLCVSEVQNQKHNQSIIMSILNMATDSNQEQKDKSSAQYKHKSEIFDQKPAQNLNIQTKQLARQPSSKKSGSFFQAMVGLGKNQVAVEQVSQQPIKLDPVLFEDELTDKVAISKKRRKVESEIIENSNQHSQIESKSKRVTHKSQKEKEQKQQVLTFSQSINNPSSVRQSIYLRREQRKKRMQNTSVK